jgi:hypothetical protein
MLQTPFHYTEQRAKVLEEMQKLVFDVKSQE